MKHYKLIILAVFIAVLAAGPLIFLNSEMKNFVSPSRGAFAPGAALSIEQDGTQPRVNASFSDYRLLIDRIFEDSQTHSIIHHGFYFGIILLILIPIALLRSKDKLVWPFFITAIFTASVGAGKEFFVFPSLVKHVPGFNMMRHTFMFSQLVSFLLICTSGFGLKAILSEKSKFKIPLITIIAGLVLFLAAKDNIGRVLILSSCIVIVLSLMLLKIFKNRVLAVRTAYLLFFLILILDICFFNIALSSYAPSRFVTRPYDNLSPPAPVIYPLERGLFARQSPAMPFDFFPLYFKEASLTSRRENLIFLRNTRLHDMLRMLRQGSRHELAFGVGMPTMFFTNNARVFGSNMQKDEMIKEIFRDFIDEEQKTLRVFFQENEIDFDVPDKRKAKYFLGPDAMAIIKRDDPNRIDIVIDVPADGFLTRLENFHRGWKATIDGVPAKIYRANYAFQAIQLPVGKHRVVFEFKTIYPILFWIYILISVFVWFSLNYYLYRFKPEENRTQT